MTEIGRSAKTAKECADVLMKAMGKKALPYIREWNELMLYLEHRMREESK